jgi:hypothetical protein
MKIELLKINMKMMKRKVLPPKTTSTVVTETTPPAQADSPTATSEAGAGATTQAEVPEEHFDL